MLSGFKNILVVVFFIFRYKIKMTKLVDTIETILKQVNHEKVRITQHAQQEMTEENILLDDVFEAIQSSKILENYPEHRRGACCLICGLTARKRPLHIVCTTGQEMLIIITVYEPKPPKWISPTERRK